MIDFALIRRVCYFILAVCFLLMWKADAQVLTPYEQVKKDLVPHCCHSKEKKFSLCLWAGKHHRWEYGFRFQIIWRRHE